jgi:lysophospholipase L1-like esterase
MRHSLLALVLVAMLVVVPTATGVSQQAVAAPSASVRSSVVQSNSVTSSGPAPLIVLMDISGSMSDTVNVSNGTGTVVKLDAAKKALQSPIQNEPPGASVGIWAFPGGAGDGEGCSPGSWLVDVGSGDSSSQILHEIDGLQADGDTPTGPALTDAVNSLKARGIENANIVVVSDGLFNCGDDPCDVAKGLANSGFTISIQAVGFDITDDGAQDLKCMAQATGGSYFSVSDGAALNDVITKLTTPTFRLTLSAPSRPIAGKAATIKATLTNASAYDAPDVKLSLGFNDSSKDLLDPDVVPPTIDIGTLPPGQTASRSWTFVAGTSHFLQKAIYSVSATSLETLPIETSGTFTTVAPDEKAADSGAILGNLIKTKQSLVILGDSYSSGEGTSDYLPGSRGAGEACHRSPDTYLAPMFTAAKVNVDILACSGATTRELLSPQINPGSGTSFADAQLAQLNALTTTPGAAIMTIGGNDIGFKDILAQCISPQAACTDDDNWRQTVLAYPGEIVPTLVTAYENTWRVLNQPKFVAKRGGKYAPLIVVGYPLVAWDPKNGVCSFANIGGLVHHDLNVAELKFAKNLETNLDDAINEAVDEAHAAGYGVVYSDATVSAFQPDNTVCASQSERFVNQIKLDPTVAGDVDPESFHPNVNGYKSESEALIAWSKSKAAAVPTDLPAAEKIAANQSSLNTLLASIPGPTVPALLDPDPIPPTVVAPGQGVVIQGFKVPTGPVTVTLHSQPRILGMLEPNSKGEVHGYITIPADVSYGLHELVIEGWDKNGKPVIKTANINVRPVTPFWVDAIGLYGGWLVLASLVITIGMWLRSRRTRFTKGIG